MKKRIAAIVLALTMTACMAMEVSAAPKAMADGQLFDPVFYATTYADMAPYAGQEALLYAHYVNIGKAQGRLPYEQNGGAVTGSEVWITKSGKKYHSTNTCGQTDASRAYKASKADAEKKGLTPCSKCY